MQAKYIKKTQAEFSNMTYGQTYTILSIEADDYRIVNDRLDPCLYDPSHFEIVDTDEPNFWISETGEDGERYAGPKQWVKAGFFEDYHDRIESVVFQFWKDCETLYGITLYTLKPI